MKRSFIKAGFWLLLVLAGMAIAVIGCPFGPTEGPEDEDPTAEASPTPEVSPTPEASPTTGTLRGRVTDATTGNPIEGATVTTDPPSKTSVTDSEGNYVLADIEAGNYTVTVSKDGYESDTFSAFISEGGDSTIDVVLVPPTVTVTSVEVSPASATINIGETVTLAATVTYGDGPTDSDVTWSSLNPSVATVSAASDAVVTGVSAGGATITARSNKDTSFAISAIVTVATPTPTPIQVSATNSTVVASPTSVNVDGVSTSAVTVTLKDENNDPVTSKDSVTISSGTHPIIITPSSIVFSDSSGQAVFAVKSTQGGTATITATDNTANVVISSTASITFLADPTWVTKASVPTGRRDLAVGVVNNKIYAIGGTVEDGSNAFTTVEEYDPATDRWTTKTSLTTGRYDLAVGVVNNKIYAIGGCSGLGCLSLKTIEEYDPVTDQWTTKASMQSPGNRFAAGVVNNKIYAIGGAGNSVEEYDPLTDTWTPKAPILTVRSSHAVGVVGGKIYAIGGGTVAESTIVEEYDPATDTWTTKAPMPTGRQSLAVGVVNNKIYAIGGVTSNLFLTGVEEYDPSNDTWMTKTPVPSGGPSTDPSAGVVNNKIYAMGGGNLNISAIVVEGTLSGTLPEWNNPPTANAGLDKTATANITVNFSGSGTDFESDPLSYAWDFDYQSGVFTQDAISQSASHTYTATGTFTAVLQVSDSKGALNRDSLVVTVNP